VPPHATETSLAGQLAHVLTNSAVAEIADTCKALWIPALHNWLAFSLRSERLWLHFGTRRPKPVLLCACHLIVANTLHISD
jgi:hypothetical protein